VLRPSIISYSSLGLETGASHKQVDSFKVQLAYFFAGINASLVSSYVYPFPA